jgi:phosphoribosylglycinamide formyltransferase 1
MKKNIAIFASGGGSNALKIIEHFLSSSKGNIALIVCNKANAGVLEIAEQFDIQTLIINKKDFYESEDILKTFEQHQIDFVVLAGFLWLMPAYLVKAFPQGIVNIHPALLPKYGGKGMYGHYVHEAVKAAGESESGMTIHYVNEHYDEGSIIFQATCLLESSDSPDDIARKVLALEHAHYAMVIEGIL